MKIAPAIFHPSHLLALSEQQQRAALSVVYKQLRLLEQDADFRLAIDAATQGSTRGINRVRRMFPLIRLPVVAPEPRYDVVRVGRAARRAPTGQVLTLEHLADIALLPADRWAPALHALLLCLRIQAKLGITPESILHGYRRKTLTQNVLELLSLSLPSLNFVDDGSYESRRRSSATGTTKAKPKRSIASPP